jgi:hypothetical protein
MNWSLILGGAALAYLVYLSTRKPQAGAAAAAVPAFSGLQLPPASAGIAAPAPPPPPPPAGNADPTDPRPAIDRLLVVRDRLAGMGRLDGENTQAVDRLMLELVHGTTPPSCLPKEAP